MQFIEDRHLQTKLRFMVRVVSANEVQDELNAVMVAFSADHATLVATEMLLLQAGKILLTIAYYDR